MKLNETPLIDLLIYVSDINLYDEVDDENPDDGRFLNSVPNLLCVTF